MSALYIPKYPNLKDSPLYKKAGTTPNVLRYPCLKSRDLMCNESSKGRSWQDTAGVVNRTLLIFTGPCGPGIANSNHTAKTGIDIQDQGPGGESVHGSWKPFALMVTATGDLIREKEKGLAS